MGHLGLGTPNLGRDTDIDDANKMVAALLDPRGHPTIDISPVYGDGLVAQVLGSVFDGGVTAPRSPSSRMPESSTTTTACGLTAGS